jgi:hypothetical protein
MKELEQNFEYKKFFYSQIARKDNVALYSKRQFNWLCCSYEVILVQKHDGFNAFGRVFPPAEHFPSSNEWGFKGFTYQKREDALHKYNALILA